jgi:hypothetical protein
MEKPKVISVPMHEGATFSWKMPEWVKLAIAESLILFGRLEQEIIEIAWLLKDANAKEKVKVARTPATENFDGILAVVEEHTADKLNALRSAFEELARNRNLIAHGCWLMIDGAKPWVVWHKFIEDDENVVGEYFEKARFEKFKKQAEVILGTCKKYHQMLEEGSGKITSALTKLPADK